MRYFTVLIDRVADGIRGDVIPETSLGSTAAMMESLGFIRLYEGEYPTPFQKKLIQLREDTEQLNVICPAGIGDFYWIFAKFHHVAATRPTTFWFPAGEQKRAGEYAEIVGATHDYLPGLSTAWVWEHPSESPIPETGMVVVQANRHLEAGKKLRDWYPDLPYKTPQPMLWEACKCEAADWVGQKQGVLAFLCQERYMGGQLPRQEWGRILGKIEDEIAPVRLIGSGADVPYARSIFPHYQPRGPHLFDRPLREVMEAAVRSKGFIGLAGGPGIVALSLGCPTLMAYPTHLLQMPGAWEPDDVAWRACAVSTLEATLDSGEVKGLFQ